MSIKSKLSQILLASAVMGELGGMPPLTSRGTQYVREPRPKPSYDVPTTKAIKKRRKANKVARKSRQINRA